MKLFKKYIVDAGTTLSSHPNSFENLYCKLNHNKGIKINKYYLSLVLK
jgi:hypothetical protein